MTWVNVKCCLDGFFNTEPAGFENLLTVLKKNMGYGCKDILGVRQSLAFEVLLEFCCANPFIYFTWLSIFFGSYCRVFAVIKCQREYHFSSCQLLDRASVVILFHYRLEIK